MKKLLLIIPMIFILVGCKSTVSTNETTMVDETTKVLESTTVEVTTTVEEETAQLESTTVVVVETAQSETTKIVDEPKSNVEVNIGGAEVEFTEEELKEPEIDFAKLQEELDRQAQAAKEAQAQAIAQQQALQAQQAQAAAQAQAQQAAQAQAKQGTDKNGHPYLAPGASYTWGGDGKPIEAPENGREITVTNPNTGQTFGYDSTIAKWLDLTNGNEKEHEAFRKSMEGTRKLTDEEARKIGEMIARGMGAD